MNTEIKAFPKKSLIDQFARTVPVVIVLALGSFAFHWQALSHAEQMINERSNARAKAIMDSSSIAIAVPLLGNDFPSVMTYVEQLVAQSPDVLLARVQQRNGKVVAEAQSQASEHAAADTARTLTQPIMISAGYGESKPIGALEMRMSAGDLPEIAAANTQLLVIEGGMCLLLCGGLVYLARSRGRRSPISAGVRASGVVAGAPGKVALAPAVVALAPGKVALAPAVVAKSAPARAAKSVQAEKPASSMDTPASIDIPGPIDPPAPIHAGARSSAKEVANEPVKV